MKFEEAKRIVRLEDALEFCKKQSMLEQVVGKEEFKHYSVAADAIEKQIPTQPYSRDLWELGTAEGYSCPCCGYDFPVNYFEPHCCKCGQAIKYKHKDYPTEKGDDSK